MYDVAASVGFASLENLIYVLSYGLEVMFLRATPQYRSSPDLWQWGYALGHHYVSRGNSRMLIFGSLAVGVHALFNVLVFALPLAVVGLVIAGGFWPVKALNWGQRVSSSRRKRNHPQIECQTCGTAVILRNRF